MGFSYVGDFSQQMYQGEGNDLFKDGGLGKVALHGLAGGVGAELTGGDFEAGVASGAFRELISPLTSDQSETTQLAVSQLAGTAVGGDEGATTGNQIVTSETHKLYTRKINVEKKVKGHFFTL